MTIKNYKLKKYLKNVEGGGVEVESLGGPSHCSRKRWLHPFILIETEKNFVESYISLYSYVDR